MIYMDTGMYGIKKVIPTRDVLFVLDNSGAVHKYETDTDEWVHGILWNVVDIVTDASNDININAIRSLSCPNRIHSDPSDLG